MPSNARQVSTLLRSASPLARRQVSTLLSLVAQAREGVPPEPPAESAPKLTKGVEEERDDARQGGEEEKKSSLTVPQVKVQAARGGLMAMALGRPKREGAVVGGSGDSSSSANAWRTRVLAQRAPRAGTLGQVLAGKEANKQSTTSTLISQIKASLKLPFAVPIVSSEQCVPATTPQESRGLTEADRTEQDEASDLAGGGMVGEFVSLNGEGWRREEFMETAEGDSEPAEKASEEVPDVRGGRGGGARGLAADEDLGTLDLPQTLTELQNKWRARGRVGTERKSGSVEQRPEFRTMRRGKKRQRVDDPGEASGKDVEEYFDFEEAQRRMRMNLLGNGVDETSGVREEEESGRGRQANLGKKKVPMGKGWVFDPDSLVDESEKVLKPGKRSEVFTKSGNRSFTM